MSLQETQQQLRAALQDALRERDEPAGSALRSAIAALDNAGAIDSDEHAGAIEAAASGVGAAEVPRRELTDHEVQYLLAAEVDQREATAASYERLGEHERAHRLRDEADTLTPWTT